MANHHTWSFMLRAFGLLYNRVDMVDICPIITSPILKRLRPRLSRLLALLSGIVMT